MKTHFIISICLLAGFVSAGEEIIKLEPQYVEVVSGMTKIRDLEKGASINFLVTAKEGHEVEDCLAAIIKPQERADILSSMTKLVDSQGHDLGKLKDVGCSRSGDWTFVFNYESYPSPGAEWLRLTGSLPVDVTESDMLKTEPVRIKLKEGEVAAASEFRMKVTSTALGTKKVMTWFGDANERTIFGDMMTVSIEQPEDCRITGLVFTDSDGKEIKTYSSYLGYAENDRQIPSIRQEVHFVKLPEDAHVSVQYQKVKKIMQPLDFKFDLYPQKTTRTQ